MNPKEKLSLPGIDLFTDNADIDHLRYGFGFRARVRRFRVVQDLFVKAGHFEPGVRAGRLLCLDMVKPTDLEAALSASPYAYRDHACVEWGGTKDCALDRRVLSALTLCSPSIEGQSATDQIQAMQERIKRLSEFRNLADGEILLILAADQLCWAAQHLPKPLWAHVADRRRFTLLPRFVLGNEHPSLVPIIHLDEERCRRSVEAADMLDAAILAGRQSDEAPAVLELARDVFKMKSAETKDATLTRWGKGLIALRAHVERADVASALVVAWNYDLVENGTVLEPDAKRETRARYARIANRPLWRMISALPSTVGRWAREDLSAGYLAMMVDESCTDLSALGAAISSFQAFLEETFDIPTLQLGLHKLVPDAKPRAQWVVDCRPELTHHPR
jgi:hypothetical protein